MYITQLIEDRQKEREQLLARIETSNRLVGRFKAKLLQLVSPRTTRDADFLPEPQATPTNPPIPNDAPLADNPANTYEHTQQTPEAAL